MIDCDFILQRLFCRKYILPDIIVVKQDRTGKKALNGPVDLVM